MQNVDTSEARRRHEVEAMDIHLQEQGRMLFDSFVNNCPGATMIEDNIVEEDDEESQSEDDDLDDTPVRLGL